MLTILYFDKKVCKGKLKDLPKIKNKPLWIDVTKITQEEADILEGTFNLHPVTIKDLVHANVRIKVEEFPDYLFCVFYGLTNGRANAPHEIDFVLSKNVLITNHIEKSVAVQELMQNPKHIQTLFERGLGFLFHYILDREIDHFDPVIATLDNDIEELENKVTKQPIPEYMNQMLGIKRRLINIRRVAFTQREKISQLAKEPSVFIPRNLTPYLRDLYDVSIRVVDDIDTAREAVGYASELYLSTTSNKMSEIMKVLSVFATIALPLTVISGIYGTNFAFLPGMHNPYGFWMMIGMMVLVCVSLLGFFRFKRWF